MFLLLITLAVVVIYGPHLWAKHVLDRFNQRAYFSGNGFDLARLLLDQVNLEAVSIAETTSGDHYDPEDRTIRLTRARCGQNTLTAVVVAAHEVGHAIQDNLNFTPFKARTRMITTAVRLEKVGAAIIMVVPIITLITRIPAAGLFMFLGGLATLCIPVLVHLLTLPVEFDASFKRALPLLVAGRYIPQEDIPEAKKILLACALTYVANALAGLLNFWRWIRLLRR